MTERLIPVKLQFFAITVSIVLLLFIVELIRKDKLKEGYSILWFGLGLSLLIMSVWTDLLRVLSRLIGVEYEPAMLLTVLVIGIIVLMIHFSVLVSDFDKRNKALTQHNGLLMWEIKKLKEELAGNSQKVMQSNQSHETIGRVTEPNERGS